MIAAAIIVTSPSPFQIGFASAQQIDGMKPTANSAPIALYITLCLWSERRPAAMCHELPLTPGAAGPGFASMEACRDGQQEALRKWLTQAGPVFGFTAMSGDGYRIEGQHCSPAVGDLPAREGKMDTRSLSRTRRNEPRNIEGFSVAWTCLGPVVAKGTFPPILSAAISYGRVLHAKLNSVGRVCQSTPQAPSETGRCAASCRYRDPERPLCIDNVWPKV